MDLTDQEYVKRCRDGHPEDFAVLVHRYQGPLFSYLASRLGDHLQAEETAQESFVRAFLSLKKLRKPFTSKGTPSQFVPYEIKLKNGGIKKHNLALRKDKRTGRWFFDGGI